MAKVTDITSIADEAARAQIEVRCLRLAEALLVKREDLASIGEVIELAAQVRANPGTDA
jgi:5-methylthioribose kinase